MPRKLKYGDTYKKFKHQNGKVSQNSVDLFNLIIGLTDSLENKLNKVNRDVIANKSVSITNVLHDKKLSKLKSDKKTSDIRNYVDEKLRPLIAKNKKIESELRNIRRGVSALIDSLKGETSTKAIQDLTYEPIDRHGKSGDDVSITYTDPGGPDEDLDVSVSDDDIDVSLATNGSSVITSTADEIKEAIDCHNQARKKVSITVSGTGTNVQTAQAKTNLEGGKNALNKKYKKPKGI